MRWRCERPILLLLTIIITADYVVSASEVVVDDELEEEGEHFAEADYLTLDDLDENPDDVSVVVLTSAESDRLDMRPVARKRIRPGRVQGGDETIELALPTQTLKRPSIDPLAQILTNEVVMVEDEDTGADEPPKAVRHQKRATTTLAPVPLPLPAPSKRGGARKAAKNEAGKQHQAVEIRLEPLVTAASLPPPKTQWSEEDDDEDGTWRKSGKIGTITRTPPASTSSSLSFAEWNVHRQEMRDKLLRLINVDRPVSIEQPPSTQQPSSSSRGTTGRPRSLRPPPPRVFTKEDDDDREEPNSSASSLSLPLATLFVAATITTATIVMSRNV